MTGQPQTLARFFGDFFFSFRNFLQVFNCLSVDRTHKLMPHIILEVFFFFFFMKELSSLK